MAYSTSFMILWWLLANFLIQASFPYETVSTLSYLDISRRKENLELTLKEFPSYLMSKSDESLLIDLDQLINQ